MTSEDLTSEKIAQITAYVDVDARPGVLAPGISPFHVITWEPVYENLPVTRTSWPGISTGKQRAFREWEEVTPPHPRTPPPADQDRSG